MPFRCLLNLRGFVVASSGNMMLMQGLPSTPCAFSIDVDDRGKSIWV